VAAAATIGDSSSPKNTQLEDLSDEHQHDDDRRGLEVDVDLAGMVAEAGREDAPRDHGHDADGPARPLLMAIGIHGQTLLVDRGCELVMAKHASAATPRHATGEQLTLKAFEAIRDLLC
jgi:hypothetical protein